MRVSHVIRVLRVAHWLVGRWHMGCRVWECGGWRFGSRTGGVWLCKVHERRTQNIAWAKHAERCVHAAGKRVHEGASCSPPRVHLG